MVSQSMLRPRINIKTILWLLVVWAGVTLAAWNSSHIYGRSVLPVYAWSIKHISNHYRVQSLRIEKQGGEWVFKLNALTTGVRQVGRGAIPDGISLSSSTLLAHALQHVIVIYTLLLIWPVVTVWRKLTLLVLSLPYLVLVEILDVPFVLLGAMDDLLLSNFIPSAIASSFFISWMNTMNSGGRLALSLIAAAATILTWRYLDLYITSTKFPRCN